MKKMLSVLLAVMMIATLALTGCGQNNDPQPDPQPSGLTGSVATDGSTSMQKVINTLGEAFMNENKGITFTYNPTGSGSGIKAVQEGRCDIGLSSRALKAEEKEAGLKETVLAYDGIAIIVNPENPVSDLTLEQIADIYTGRITNWKDLGGNDAEIVLIGREAGSGTRDGFETITGTSDALNTDAIMNLIVAANPGIDTIGLLYDLSQDASTQAIADAKAFCEKNGIKVVEKNGTTTAEVQMAAEALVAAGVKAVFPPTDNTIMTAELSIYESFIEAGVQHYTGADSFVTAGAFATCGVNYTELGTYTADMVLDILESGNVPEYHVMDGGIITVNTETAAALGIDYAAFSDMASQVVEVTTQQ